MAAVGLIPIEEQSGGAVRGAIKGLEAQNQSEGTVDRAVPSAKLEGIRIRHQGEHSKGDRELRRQVLSEDLMAS